MGLFVLVYAGEITRSREKSPRNPGYSSKLGEMGEMGNKTGERQSERQAQHHVSPQAAQVESGWGPGADMSERSFSERRDLARSGRIWWSENGCSFWQMASKRFLAIGIVF
jgi:hypothetical protein